ncbi:alpha/beta hydrolase [Agrobacterium vitis]|nr:hypothetical protein [Agrobacterium vitis]MCE6076824.1 alpha/beta hydrolase [Agrobacterium vitis]MCM2470842.1 alpha/beta hydrolase [Agrobacterium vitis]MUO71208.1 alpha/beta hydrolase [Agrobacterium vitis]MUO84328.1 alpha/beta hydrolase [Agrobacterium vitis]
MSSSLDPSGSTSHQPKPLSIYESGATTVVALAGDPRFSYCLYVPSTGDVSQRALLCVIHGSYRDFTIHRDQFRDFGEANNCVILAPLFPGNVLGDGNLDGFKYLLEGDIRYDNVLEAMVAQVSDRYHLSTKKFGLAGFSGGAHFSHRYLLLRPERLWAVSVGAPGSVTLLNHDQDWWPGIRDMADKFGVAVDPARLGEVPIQLVVGDADTDTQEIAHRPGGLHWTEGANDAGNTRPERLRALEKSLAAVSVSVTFDLLADVGHEAAPIFSAAQAFLALSLNTHRKNVI